MLASVLPERHRRALAVPAAEPIVESLVSQVLVVDVAIRFRDGEVGATVAGTGPAATPKPRTRARDDKKDGPQGSLL